MSSTFGSLAFRAVREDVWVALPAQDALVAERVVPYGDLVIVDLGGLGVRHYTTAITVLAAAVSSWRSALLTAATLTVADVSYGDAVLVQLSDEQVTLDRTLHAFTARFLLDVVVAP